jgi:hypothetical protein
MPIKITGPDGRTAMLTPPEGATDEQIQAKIAEIKTQWNVQVPQQEMSVLDTAKDVAKSAGVGVVQGAIGLTTIPGNIEQLGRLGINKVAELAGADGPVVNPDTYLPNYGDAKAGAERKLRRYGIADGFYEPKTTAGEYARTGGEFASLALGPGGTASRVARVAVPAVASETAGQLTEGTALEPWARLGGALLGGRAASAGQRAVTPLPTSPQHRAAVRTLENEGVTSLTAGDRTGRKPLQWAESATQDTPGAGGRAARMATEKQEQFTRATLRRIGVNADRAEPHVMAQAYTDIGQRFNQLAGRNNLMPSRHFDARLRRIGSQYESATSPTMRVPMVEQTIASLRNPALRQNGVIPGRLYQNMRSDLSREANRLRASDPPAGRAVSEIMDALDDAMEASIRLTNRGDLGAWRQVRGQYRNFIAVEDAVSRAGAGVEGIITPAALRGAITRQGRRAYTQGRGDFNQLARAGETVMRPLPNSGTTPRANAMHILGAIGGVATGSPYPAVAGLFGPAVGSRLLMSGPMQRYLSNQATGALPAIPQAPASLRGLLAYPGALEAGLLGDQ